MGASLLISLVMIVGIFGLIVVQGSRTFWPQPIERVTLASSQVVLGMPVEHDDAGGRTLYRVGNRDLGQAPFRWIDDKDIVSKDAPRDAVLLERTDWGIWLGEVQKVLTKDGDQQRALAEGESALAYFQEVQPLARERAERIESMTRDDLGDLNTAMEKSRLAVRRAELEARRTEAATDRTLEHPLAFGSVIFAAIIPLALAVGLQRVRPVNRLQRTVFRGAKSLLVMIAAALLLFAWLEGPLTAPDMPPERLAQIKADADANISVLEATYADTQKEIETLRAQDATHRVVVVEPTTGHMSPLRQGDLTNPMMVSQTIRIIPANALTGLGKLRVYLSRWWEYVSTQPRNSNTEGGVFPVIFGTVTLTMLLAIAVVPLGVIAALFLREYARQGPLVSLIRIAVNNLAGVPSVVYGVFGLGFFAYSVGAYIDAGPASPAPRGMWWWGIAGCIVVVTLAFSLAMFARGVSVPSRRHRLNTVIGVCWLAGVGLAVWAVSSSPYFGGFFAEKLPTSTFGTRGILWASLTLALLTLPVVIVATEEAISAVPRSVREGSYGCGASKWQTIRRIVLPQALPGIMTGAILAMARGAGEVAPLMLIGAVKSAPELPVDSHFPFVHGERSFMHLGFHIFDLGFQSPDSEAARPLVWTTTLLLVLIILALNLAAVLIRARLRARVINASV